MLNTMSDISEIKFLSKDLQSSRHMLQFAVNTE